MTLVTLVTPALFPAFQPICKIDQEPNSVTKKAISKPAAPDTALSKPYQRTPYEQGVLEAIKTARREQPPSLKVQKDKKGIAVTLEVDHADQGIGHLLLMKSLGTADFEFFDGLVRQLLEVGSAGANQAGLRYMLSMVQGIEPRDQVEAMLAAQMAATHNAIMTFANRLNHVETLPQQDGAERAFNKLGRTFAAQVEALKRYRSSGDQTMRVEHVTVNEGGQAIVGNVTGMGRGGSEKARSSS